MTTTMQVFLDIETSGGSQQRVIELAMITRVIGPRGGLKHREEWVKLFDISPDEVHWWATKNLHGIRDSHLIYQDPITEHLPFIIQRLGEADMVIAHNYTADQRFLINEFTLHDQFLPIINWVCTRAMADRASWVPWPEQTRRTRRPLQGGGSRFRPPCDARCATLRSRLRLPDQGQMTDRIAELERQVLYLRLQLSRAVLKLERRPLPHPAPANDNYELAL